MLFSSHLQSGKAQLAPILNAAPVGTDKGYLSQINSVSSLCRSYEHIFNLSDLGNEKYWLVTLNTDDMISECNDVKPWTLKVLSSHSQSTLYTWNHLILRSSLTFWYKRWDWFMCLNIKWLNVNHWRTTRVRGNPIICVQLELLRNKFLLVLMRDDFLRSTQYHLSAGLMNTSSIYLTWGTGNTDW